jgi:hypothetical protein
MKKLFAALVACIAMSAFGQPVLSAATTTGAGAGYTAQKATGNKTFQAVGTVSNSTGSVTLNVECSITGTSWDVLGTITLALTTTASSNSFTSSDRCAQVRGNVTAISGTGASVSLYLGY